MSKVSDHLKNHVRAYYHSSSVKSTDINEVDLQKFSYTTEVEASVAKRLLLDSSTRGEAIRLFLAWVILSRCDGTRTQSLLPSGISAIARNAPPGNASNTSKLRASPRLIRLLTTTQLKPRFSVNGRSLLAHCLQSSQSCPQTRLQTPSVRQMQF